MKKILEHTFQDHHFRPPKIRGFGLGRTGEKCADSDANSESVTTQLLRPRLLLVYGGGPGEAAGM